MNKIFKKIGCLSLAVILTFSLSSCSNKNNNKSEAEPTNTQTPATKQPSYDTPAENIIKSETVYVNMSPDGTVTSKTVTDWLHTDTAETYIDDKTDLSDIKNVKSDILPVDNSDGTKRWNMETTDLYYRGTTTKDLPINMDITYYLDGEKTTVEEIAGKSGQVKMIITLTNTSLKEVTVNGKKTKIYTPFICAGGMIFEENQFSNITVENGKTIGDGTKEIALLIGTPGLKESLGLSDELLKQLGDFDFNCTYTITVDTDNFELSNMIFAVLPLSSVISEIGSSLPGSVTDVKAQLNTIQSVIDKLNSMNVSQLVSQLFSSPDKITDLTNSITKVTALYNDNKALIEVLEKYMTEENINAIKKFIEDTNKTDLQEVVKLLNNPVLQTFFKQLPTLADDMNGVMPIIEGFSEDMNDPEVQKALNNLPETLETIKELKSVIDSNQELFDTFSKSFDKEAMEDLQEIVSSLDGIITEETIKKYSGLIDNADDLIARAEEWVKLGQEYTIFTTATENEKTTVSFIYETSPIKADKKDKTPPTTESTTETNKLKEWWNKIFKKDMHPKS